MDKRKCCASGELFVLVLLVSAVTQSAPIDHDTPTSQVTTVTNPQCDSEEASSQDVPRSRRALDDESQETLVDETHLEPSTDSEKIDALDHGVKLISILPATRTDATNFLGINPHTGEKELDKNNTYAFEYTKGYRIPGDEVLVSDSRHFQFPIQDISLTIFYPKGNTMVKQYVITAFRLRVSQDSPEGEGYLTAGGISLEQLGLRMVAARATVFSFELVIFGILQDLLSPDYIPEGIRPRDAGISLNNTRH